MIPGAAQSRPLLECEIRLICLAGLLIYLCLHAYLRVCRGLVWGTKHAHVLHFLSSVTAWSKYIYIYICMSLFASQMKSEKEKLLLFLWGSSFTGMTAANLQHDSALNRENVSLVFPGFSSFIMIHLILVWVSEPWWLLRENHPILTAIFTPVP